MDKTNEYSKDEQLKPYRADHYNKNLTTNQGVPVSHTDDSLKAGSRGPTLMEDFHFREKLTHFDHERIPERVVHARGFGAHGYFQAYEPMTEFTRASFLQDPSVKTPVFVRFSTAIGSRGSADTVRDVRGFATKFYTKEGTYDLVANNIPVFFIHDAIKFPDLIHALKPEPHNEIPQASGAHDTFWDFVASTPETAHMVLWLMSDRAIPQSFRMMEGFSVNTFRFFNNQGKAHFVKLHWKPVLGTHSLVWDEAQKLAGKDPDYNRRDVWDAINRGDFPEFELGVQMVKEEDEFNFDFDILDATKLWPEEVIPVKKIGKMTLDRNVDNFFAETEQVAFHPGNVVPGIDFTNDPLLQGRLFSYLDTQLIRLGGPNFHEIPINRPIAPLHNNQRDGYHRMTIDKGRVSYFPNALQGNSPHPVPDQEGGYVHYTEKVEGRKVRERSKSFNDHYRQSKIFWNSMSPIEKQHIIEAFHFELGGVMDKQVKQRIVDMYNNIDGHLATQIAMGIGATPPANPSKADVSDSSPAVSQENTIKTAKTRQVAILAENGVNFSEVNQVMNALNSAGLHCHIVSSKQGMITGVDGQQLEVNKSWLGAGSVMYDAVYVPGGRQSVDQLMQLGDALHFINEAFKHAKTIGATNEGVDLLTTSQIKGAKTAGKDTHAQLVKDQGVLTIQNAADMGNHNQEGYFSQEFINAIAQHRHWERANQKKFIPA
ncbi:catalase [Desulfitispora alkaliphila]|uniref:catalase n=1 Tax=Desulfitispora alkaliphila TaxID=622674 RepID=UPI003D226221